MRKAIFENRPLGCKTGFFNVGPMTEQEDMYRVGIIFYGDDL